MAMPGRQDVRVEDPTRLVRQIFESDLLASARYCLGRTFVHRTGQSPEPRVPTEMLIELAACPVGYP
jgi:hypothetical protein